MAVFSSIIGALAGTGAAAGTAGAAGAAGAATGLSGALGAVGTVAGIAGTGLQVAGQAKANAAAAEQADLARAQMNLEARRNRRAIIRESIVARANALSTATAQGAQQSSGLQGGLAQISGQTGENLTGSYQAQEIGQSMFAAKAAEAKAQTLSSIGAGISSLGGALVDNQERLGRLGTYSVS